MRRVTIAVALFCAVLCAAQLYRWHIWTFGTDTGTFGQIVLDAFGGFRDGPEQGTHFRFHWAPSSASSIRCRALAFGAVAAVRADRADRAQRLPALRADPPLRVRAHRGRCGVLPLIYPPLQAVAFGEFHEIAFYPAIALGLIWAADRERLADLRRACCRGGADPGRLLHGLHRRRRRARCDRAAADGGRQAAACCSSNRPPRAHSSSPAAGSRSRTRSRSRSTSSSSSRASASGNRRTSTTTRSPTGRSPSRWRCCCTHG